MKERKFKVGDRVVEKINQKKGIVVDFSYISGNVLVKFDGWNKGHDGNANTRSGKTYSGNNCWYFEEELLEIIKDETIVIYRKDNKVIALDKSTGEKAEAKCNPADEFDFRTGAKLAFNRLMGEDVKTDNVVREVKRKAKVGEYIKIVNAKPFNGEILRVIGVKDSGCTVENSDKRLYTWHEEYVVLENYKPEDNAKKADENEIHVGDMVEVTHRGKFYSSYNKWSGLGSYRQNYVKGVSVEDGMVAKVLNISQHDDDKWKTLALIQNPKTSQVFIIGIDGIKKVER